MAHAHTALILGASKGLGKEIAAACRARGWGTIEVSRSLAESMEDGRRTIQCDLGDERQAIALASRIDLTHVTHFFWVVGIWWKGAFAAMEPKALLELVDVNYRNPLIPALAAWNAFAQAEAPRTFVVVGSTSGLRARAGEAAYVGTKWGQLGIAKSLGEEARVHRSAGTDIRVRLFCPGGMRTELFTAAPPPNYECFMDPAKVADHLLRWIASSDAAYEEQVVDRASALGESLR